MSKERSCQNCNHEELCNHDWSGICEDWRPDLDYEREQQKEENAIGKERYGK